MDEAPTGARTTADSLAEGRLKVDAGANKKKRTYLLNMLKGRKQ